MKVKRGELQLATSHFERLLSGLVLLGFTSNHNIDPALISLKILELCAKNGCEQSARVRLTVSRNNENGADYFIETVPLPPPSAQDQAPLSLCLYPYARKTIDLFSNLKTTSYLQHIQAFRYATENGYDEAILLNSERAVCEGSRTNIFLINGDKFYTPALHQGCVGGVMRRSVINRLRTNAFRVYETRITEQELKKADEIFLTNAIIGCRPVARYHNIEFSQTFFTTISAEVFNS